MRLFSLLIATVATLAVSGCAVSPADKAPEPDFPPTYLESKYDRGLVDGPNRHVDLARLVDNGDDRDAVAYAMEIVATTPFSVIVDSIRRVYEDAEMCKRLPKGEIVVGAPSKETCAQVNKPVLQGATRKPYFVPFWQALETIGNFGIVYAESQLDVAEDWAIEKSSDMKYVHQMPGYIRFRSKVDKFKMHAKAVGRVFRVAAAYAKYPGNKVEFTQLTEFNSGCFYHAVSAWYDKKMGAAFSLARKIGTREYNETRNAVWSAERCGAFYDAMPLKIQKDYMDGVREFIRQITRE